jgi:hypothetical protein
MQAVAIMPFLLLQFELFACKQQRSPTVLFYLETAIWLALTLVELRLWFYLQHFREVAQYYIDANFLFFQKKKERIMVVGKYY